MWLCRKTGIFYVNRVRNEKKSYYDFKRNKVKLITDKNFKAAVYAHGRKVSVHQTHSSE